MIPAQVTLLSHLNKTQRLLGYVVLIWGYVEYFRLNKKQQECSWGW